MCMPHHMTSIYMLLFVEIIIIEKQLYTVHAGTNKLIYQHSLHMQEHLSYAQRLHRVTFHLVHDNHWLR